MIYFKVVKILQLKNLNNKKKIVLVDKDIFFNQSYEENHKYNHFKIKLIVIKLNYNILIF